MMFQLKKTGYSVVCACLLAIGTVGLGSVALPAMARAAELQMAPENPQFTQYIQNKELGLLQTLSDDGHPLSFTPSPLKLPAMTTRAVLTADVLTADNETPASFDLRTVGGVTAVKDQGSCGSCWAFATYASMESYLKYKYSRHQTHDYSEGDLNQNHGFDIRECEGGNFDMATAYLARWDGPVDTSDVPYPYSTSVLGATSGVKIRKHVQNVWYIPDRKSYTDNDGIKTAVKTYGAVAVSFYYSASYYNATSAAYYYSVATSSSNHAVAIVGWDDNYSISNFTAGRQPPGNGAFIVKNSWGTNWGKEGYFYLSYYDKSLSVGVCYNNAELTSNYKRIYDYDPLGWTTSVGYSSTTAWFANVFDATTKASKIKAVSLYSPVPNAAYQVFIYSNVSGADPANGTLVKTLSGTLAKAGYRTIKTAKVSGGFPSVSPGAKFSVVVKLTTPDYKYPIPVEMDFEGYSSAANAYTGQSYIGEDGETWSDLTELSIGTTSLEKANVCLKAFGG